MRHTPAVLTAVHPGGALKGMRQKGWGQCRGGKPWTGPPSVLVPFRRWGSLAWALPGGSDTPALWPPLRGPASAHLCREVSGPVSLGGFSEASSPVAPSWEAVTPRASSWPLLRGPCTLAPPRAPSMAPSTPPAMTKWFPQPGAPLVTRLSGPRPRPVLLHTCPLFTQLFKKMFFLSFHHFVIYLVFGALCRAGDPVATAFTLAGRPCGRQAKGARAQHLACRTSSAAPALRPPRRTKRQTLTVQPPCDPAPPLCRCAQESRRHVSTQPLSTNMEGSAMHNGPDAHAW